MRSCTKILAIIALFGAVEANAATAVQAQGFWSDVFGAAPYAANRRAPDGVRRYEQRRQRGAAENRNRAPNAKINPDRLAEASSGVRPSAPPPPSAPPMIAVVSLKSQSMTVWGENGAIMQTRVSSGQPGYGTPAGVFSIIQKNRYHESNIYSGAPMPFMQRITWSGIALHAGVVPNYPASHGCIRLPYDVAQRLFGMTKMGMRVLVATADTQPQWIEHPGLPQPYLMPPAEVVGLVQQMAGDGAGRSAAASTSPDYPLNPREVALRLKAETTVAVKRKAALAREALAQAALKSAEANAAAAELRSRRAALALAEAEARSNALVADTSETIDRAAAKVKSDEHVIEARRLYEVALEDDAAKSPPSFAAARAAREAEVAADDAPEQMKEAVRRLEPLSIFISRQERQLFVRQGFEAVLESPVDIADIDTPMGTHVFTAMPAAAEGAPLRWLGVTMPNAQGGASTAQAALQRITLPDHVRDEISRRLWTGASLVISDHGVSSETGRGTDFVVLMK